jgi:hypothetical protein
MVDFQMTLEDYKLMDLSFTGPQFTWTNERGGSDLTLERLDRAVANQQWCSQFDVAEVSILVRISSYHNPLLVEFSNSHEVRWTKNRRFRFEGA